MSPYAVKQASYNLAKVVADQGFNPAEISAYDLNRLALVVQFDGSTSALVSFAHAIVKAGR